MSTERLQKVLASAGVASRRDCEELIAAGRVMVNGRVVRELGTRIDIEQDTVSVDGTPVRLPDVRTYIMVHKPVGVVSTVDDPQGRPTVIDLVDVPTRVFPVGRLDVDSEGLILLTNDGELTHRLTHPAFEVEKEYHVLLDRVPDAEALRQWRTGVELAGERTAPAQVRLLDRPDAAWISVVLREGRKRQIREVARLLGYKVQRLIRVREDSLFLADLAAGQWRNLRPEEVQSLRSHVVPIEADPQAGPDQRQPRMHLSRSSVTQRRKQPDDRGSDRRDDDQPSSRTHRSSGISLSNGRSRSAARGIQGRSNMLTAGDARVAPRRSSSITKRSTGRSGSAESAGAAGGTSGLDRSLSSDRTAGKKRVRADQPSRQAKPAPNRAWRERQDEERRVRQGRSRRPDSRYQSVRREGRPSSGSQSSAKSAGTKQSSVRPFNSGTSRPTWKIAEDEPEA